MAAVLLRRLFTSEFLEFYKEVSFLLFLFNHFYLLSRICVYVLQTNYSLCYRQGVIAIFPQTCILLLWTNWVLFQFKLQAQMVNIKFRDIPVRPQFVQLLSIDCFVLILPRSQHTAICMYIRIHIYYVFEQMRVS